MINSRYFGLGLAVTLALVVLAHDAIASGFGVFHTFRGKADGEFPEGGLIADPNGNLYGTTFGALANGAPGKKCGKSCGTIFGFDQHGKQTLKFSFQASKDGAFPTGELLLQGTDLYGTTEYGPGTGCGGLGCGTAYRVGTDGSEEAVFRFCTEDICADGAFPSGALTEDGLGNLYGITLLGGEGNGWLCGSSVGGCGTIYKLTSTGHRSVLHSFCSQPSCTDGAIPLGRLLLDSNGNIYGTTQFGGAFSGGTIFKLAPNGTYTVLYSFCTQMQENVCTDGAVPQAGLIADQAGNLFGTTKFGGATSCPSDLGCGVIFKLGASGGYSVLYSFLGGNDGAYPVSALVSDGSGNLYGSTLHGAGGSCPQIPIGCGSLYELATDGSESILHAFTNKADGARPEGTLLLTNGILYGTAREKGGGACGCGTLFKIHLNASRANGLWHSKGLPPRWIDDRNRFRTWPRSSAPRN